MTTRLSIDRLRAVKAARTSYSGPWLPEPIVEFSLDSRLDRDHDVSLAFLRMLERLSAEERAVFLLREVFDISYAEVAESVGKSEAACRQMLHRARERVRDERVRFEVDSSEHMRLLERFGKAVCTAEGDAFPQIFAQDVIYISDGGGKVLAASRPVLGSRAVSRIFVNVSRSLRGEISMTLASVNGQPGLLLWTGGSVFAVMTANVADGEIQELYCVRNPDKLSHVHPPRREP